MSPPVLQSGSTPKVSIPLTPPQLQSAPRDPRSQPNARSAPKSRIGRTISSRRRRQRIASSVGERTSEAVGRVSVRLSIGSKQALRQADQPQAQDDYEA